LEGGRGCSLYVPPCCFFRQNETLDPVGGHIPGAVNQFFKNNLSATAFKSPEQLFKNFIYYFFRV